MRGRPPATRQRVLNYIETHHPATVMQIVRATGADRMHIYRILHAAYGPNFRDLWPAKKISAAEYCYIPQGLIAA